MVDYVNMALDDYIQLNRVGEQPGCGRSRSRSRSLRSRSQGQELLNNSSMCRSRSRSRSISHSRPASLYEYPVRRARSRSRSISHNRPASLYEYPVRRARSRSRSISHSRPATLYEYPVRRARSRSRSKAHSRPATLYDYPVRRARSRSCQSDHSTISVRSQGGWKYRSHSRQSTRNESCDSNMNCTGQFSRNQSCGVSPIRVMSYNNDRAGRVSPWLLYTPHTQCDSLSYMGYPLHEQNLCTAYSPKYVQVTNQPKGSIWRASVNQFYPVHRNKYFEKMKALQQLRIAQQRVRHAKRLLNNKVIWYNKLQKQLVYSPPMPYRPVPFLKTGKQKSYPYLRYQKRAEKFDLADFQDGDLSVTIQNDLATRTTDSPANSGQNDLATRRTGDSSSNSHSQNIDVICVKVNDSEDENSSGWSSSSN